MSASAYTLWASQQHRFPKAVTLPRPLPPLRISTQRPQQLHMLLYLQYQLAMLLLVHQFRLLIKLQQLQPLMLLLQRHPRQRRISQLCPPQLMLLRVPHQHRWQQQPILIITTTRLLPLLIKNLRQLWRPLIYVYFWHHKLLKNKANHDYSLHELFRKIEVESIIRCLSRNVEIQCFPIIWMDDYLITHKF